jgi:hypothetical protein
MNIFILDKNPTRSAQYYVDKHVVKMPLETAQMACTVLHKILDVQLKRSYTENHTKYYTKLKEAIPYKPTHEKHPCTIWAGESYANYLKLLDIGYAICREYEYRYGRVHKCFEVLRYCDLIASKLKLQFPSITKETPYAQAMPDKYKDKDVVVAYRNYYLNEKHHLFNWKKRDIPEWITPDVLDALNIPYVKTYN